MVPRWQNAENRSGLSKVALGEIIIASGIDNNPAYREV
jgi:hypothetical protein